MLANRHIHSGVQDNYVSDFTAFMQDYLAEHPDVVEDQRLGWRIYWDHTVDWEALEQAQHDSVPAKAYEYFTLS